MEKNGGVVVGASHENGGVEFQVSGKTIELEGKEFVVPAEVLSSEKQFSVRGTIKECLETICAYFGIPQIDEKVTEIKAGDAVICKASFTDTKVYSFKGTITKVLTEMQSIHGCNPINSPQKSTDSPQSRVQYRKGGEVFDFDKNDVPSKNTYKFALYIKNKYPKVWALGGNEFGNSAFRNLEKVVKRGHWNADEEWMYKKWKSFMARHQHNVNPAGIVAMIKWLGKVNKGWDYMKGVVRESVKSKYPDALSDPKLYEYGGNIEQIKGGLADNTKLKEIAAHHGVTFIDLLRQFTMGQKVEMEHTNDPSKAAEIAKDHLWENPYYYTALKSIEGEDEIVLGINTSEIISNEYKNKIEFLYIIDVLNNVGHTIPDPAEIEIAKEMIAEHGIQYPLTIIYSIPSERIFFDNDNTEMLFAAKEMGIRYVPCIVRVSHSPSPMYGIPSLPILNTENRSTYHSTSVIGITGKSLNGFMRALQKV